ncbi:MAG: exodeoxyribonuclease III [Spirochaetaceae bacterium]|jgi:exodeoxyribonuclease-3|nr:exodeoxyribonuclease III [Spirochaetaceae bacterium]
MTRILSFNVNGIRAIEKKGFLDWLAADSPDMLCLQETKAEPGQLSDALKSPLDDEGKPYHSYWASAKKKGYSGVALFSKTEPRSVSQLGTPEFDDEGRVLIADYDDFTLITAYFPNSQDERRRLSYKLAFCDAILDKCAALVEMGRHFVLCGDYNIAHKPIDLAHPEANEDNAGYYPEERAFLGKFLAAGFVDTFRHFYPDKKEAYTWWTYRGGARDRNVGWRLDYHCVDEGFIASVQDSFIRDEVMGSDHCPVEIWIRG